MINYLTQNTFADYNDKVNPSQQVGQASGGGMGNKSARVVDVLRTVYPNVSTITSAKDINAEIVFIEPLLFFMDWCEGFNVDEELEALQNSSALKVLYNSELALMRMNHNKRTSLIAACDIVTTNCEFHRNLLGYLHIDKPLHLLCDPVPDDFHNYKSPRKKMELIVVSYISWFKNTTEVIEIFKRLEGVIKRKYVGSNSLWSNVPILPTSIRLQRELYKNCDTVFPELNRLQLAKEMRKSRFGLWVAYHDAYSYSVQEMLRSGVIIVGSNHGLTHEIPIETATGAKSKVELIKKLMEQPIPELNKRSLEISEWAKTFSSYDVFLDQVKGIIARG